MVAEKCPTIETFAVELRTQFKRAMLLLDHHRLVRTTDNHIPRAVACIVLIFQFPKTSRETNTSSPR